MLKVQTVRTSELTPYANNAKLHPAEQIDQIAESIGRFGNCDPIAVWRNGDGGIEIVEGHGRLAALNSLGIEEAPVIFLDDLTDEQRRAYCLVHNKLTMSTGFDLAILRSELDAVATVDMSQFDFSVSIPTLDGWDDDDRPEGRDVPDEFREFDEGIETHHVCQKCGYEW